MSQHPLIEEFLARQRWYAGKGRDEEVVDVTRVARIGTGDSPAVTVELVTVRDTTTTAETTYQLPLASYAEPQERLAHAWVGTWKDEDLGEVHAYDGVHDREAMAAYLRAFGQAGPDGGDGVDTGSRAGGAVSFHRLVGHDLDIETHSTLYSGEQSNSSVAFGQDALLKLFRKVTPGKNPDIEIHRVLTEAGSDNVAALYGWIDCGLDDGSSLDLGMLQQFLTTASDGWQAALVSVRNLYAEADLHAEEVGGDFAAEAYRLGGAVAEVHQVLRTHFPVSEVDRGDTAAAMRLRLDAAVSAAPQLAAYADGVRAVFDRLVSGAGRLTAQRVHGDLHLGQTLRTSLGWKLVDFEGEPARPLADRVLPDSPWRDVAGMIRSFDYAASSVEHDLSSSPDEAGQLAYRCREWAERNRQAFLEGYLGAEPESGVELTEDQAVVAAAYEADKAVYEVLYEARNRPSWIDIPLAALGRIAQTADVS